VKPGFILHWTGSPPEFFATSLETSGSLVTGTDFPWSFDALQRHPWSRPCVRQAVRAHPGSALRLSQPLSGFRSTKFHGLISCRSRSWTVPLQSFPLAEVAHPFRGRFCSLAVIHRALEMRRQRPYYPRFHRLPRFSAVAWIPRELWVPFHEAETPLPVALGHRQRSHLLCQLHLLRSLYPSLSPFALTRASPSLVADALLVFRPSRDTTAQVS
jgi:hypothetical protein